MAKNVTQEHFDATVEKLVTKTQFDTALSEFRSDLMSKLDGMSVILQRLDQERVFTIERIHRIESDVSMMKKYLKLA